MLFSFFLYFLCFCIVLVFTYKFLFGKPNNFPPGPPRFPLLGSYPILLWINYRHVHRAIDALCKYYKSDVLGFYAANFPTIVVNSAAKVRECLRNPDIDGKPPLLLAKMRSPDKNVRGIFFTQEETWHEQRRFLLRHLRDYGFGRRFDELEVEINDEILQFFDLIKNGSKYDFEKEFVQNGNICCPNVFAGIFGNIFLKVLLNERYPRSKMEILFSASKASLTFLRSADDWGRMFSYVEWIADAFPKVSDYRKIEKASLDLYNQIKPIIDDQYKSYDPAHERHFLDKYFNEIRAKQSDDKTNSFCYEQLVMLCVDIFNPALNANAITMQFLLQRLHFNPEILKKCQMEIDGVVGQGRLPTLSDRIKLPYTEATLRESMRHETLIPSNLPHVATKDTKLFNYDVPKGTIVFASLSGCNEDPTVWKEPEKFQPERFLDENGKLSLSLDHSLPFGAGRRLCAGETFARNTYFLIAAAFIQNFDFDVAPNSRMPTLDETHTGLARVAPTYWLSVKPR